MARILLGWEFGAGRGHAIALEQIAAALTRRGHLPVIAAQNVALFEEASVPLLQAPVSPRLLVNTGRPSGGAPATMGDILARLGCDSEAIVASLLRAWRQVFELVKPDAVVADFAPFLLAAARGRCPTVRFGIGFTAPPADLPCFPSLTGGAPAADEKKTLASVNAGLVRAGLDPLPALPAIFAATEDCVASFAELDPYRSRRSGGYRSPVLADPCAGEAGSGEEVFVYLPETVSAEAPLWQGLARSGLPVRVHLPRASAAHRALFERLGFAFEKQPLPFRSVAERSRLTLSHGGHGFVCSGLLAGLPQVVCHYDLEKWLNANAIAAMGTGGQVGLREIEPAAFAASLVRLYEDEALAARTRAAAPGFRGRMEDPPAEFIAERIERLLG